MPSGSMSAATLRPPITSATFAAARLRSDHADETTSTPQPAASEGVVMRKRWWVTGVCAAGAVAFAPGALAGEPVAPLSLQQDPYESIYLPPGPPREEEGVNAGGVNFNFRVSYLTDYVY